MKYTLMRSSWRVGVTLGGVNAVLVGHDLLELGTDLVTALASLDGNDLTHVGVLFLLAYTTHKSTTTRGHQQSMTIATGRYCPTRAHAPNACFVFDSGCCVWWKAVFTTAGLDGKYIPEPQAGLGKQFLTHSHTRGVVKRAGKYV